MNEGARGGQVTLHDDIHTIKLLAEVPIFRILSKHDCQHKYENGVEALESQAGVYCFSSYEDGKSFVYFPHIIKLLATIQVSVVS